MTQEALKLALEALERYGNRHRATYLLDGAWDAEITLGDKAIAAIKEALAQPEQEPVATLAVRWHDPVGKVAYVLEVNLPVGIHKLYTSTPQRTWVGLADEDVSGFVEQYWDDDNMTMRSMVRVIEAKLKEKNT
jgi:hypothetical protein